MPRDNWFPSIETIFYEALSHHNITEWYIEPMSQHIDTSLAALKRGKTKGWEFLTHNGRGWFRCPKCKKLWSSSNTTVIWRAREETGVVQVRIEKQGCRRCEIMCKGFLADDDQIVFAIHWLIQWMLKIFYNIKNDDNNINKKSEDNIESGGPHDVQRCGAGRKGTCRRCNEMKQHTGLFTNKYS